MKRTIRLTESDLHRLVKESVKRALSEGEAWANQPPIDEFHPDWWYYRQEIEPEGIKNFDPLMDLSDEEHDELLRQEFGESKLRRIIKESVKRILSENRGKINEIYTTQDQWNDETRIFMKGLRNGDAIEIGDKSIGVQWKRKDWPENDPRYIVFNFGDRRLHDDHFYVQSSPPLSDKQLMLVRDVMVRMGIVDELEFNMEYNLGMDNL